MGIAPFLDSIREILKQMFIEMTGKTLSEMLDEDELGGGSLSDVGVTDNTVVRVNQQGDIEVRRTEGWDIIGGLLGEFEARVKSATSLEWAVTRSSGGASSRRNVFSILRSFKNQSYGLPCLLERRLSCSGEV